MKRLRKLHVLFFLIMAFLSFAQEEKNLIKHIETATSAERIRSLTLYYDENIHTKSSRTLKKLNTMLDECYQIAERDNDNSFRDYLDFYKKTNPIMFFAEKNLLIREAKTLKAWEHILKFYQSAGDERFVAISNINIGYSLFLLNDYPKSIEKMLIADEKFRDMGYTRFPEMPKYLHNMALVFYYFRQYDKVAKLMEASAKLQPFDNNRHIQVFNTLGSAYTHLKLYDKAEKAFLKTKKLAILYQDSFWIAFASRALAKIYLEKGKYQEALRLYEIYFKSIEHYKDINKREYSEHLLGLAKANIFLNRLENAKQYLDNINYIKVSDPNNQTFTFGVSYQDINYWLDYYDVTRRYYFAIKDYQKAYYYSDSLYAMKFRVDSLFNGMEVRIAQNRIDVQDKQFQNDKKEATIQSKNKQMIWIGTLLIVIIIASVLLYRQNRKIKSRNEIINKQLAELSKTLDQKQILLSELQHRVKNNLQHVISILEIQKESVDFNNIDELIRGNQNRIHSMALLHKKLNVSDDANEVDFCRYVTELSELVKESYDSQKKKVNLNLQCEIETISIEKALPIGLIITELVSNSMKHAFKKRSIGIINLELTKNSTKNKLYYSDNGDGFDFNKNNEKGLGLEITKGLIHQLDGEIATNSENGFELMLYF